MKKLVIACVLLAGLSVAATTQSIGGQYTVEGTNFDGSPYTGQAEIILTSDTSCDIRWLTNSTESAGICMRNDNSFAAGYKLGEEIGLVIYKIMPDGKLVGLWTIAGKGGAGTEVLVPVR